MVVLHAVPESQLKPGSCSATGSPGLADRVWVSKAQARRRWAVRSGLLLSLTGAVIILLVVWRRDTVAMQDVTSTAERVCSSIQDSLKKDGLLPSVLPAGKAPGFEYLPYADRFYAQHATHPVILAVSPSVALKLRSDRRCVVFYDKGKVYPQWMTAVAYAQARQAQTLEARMFEQQRSTAPSDLP